MKTSLSPRRLVLFLCAAALALTPLVPRAQNQGAGPSGGPRPITLDDYPRFKRLGGASISTDGKWMLYTITPNEGDATLFIKSLDTDTVFEIPRGANASFADNAKWVGYFVSPPSGRGGAGRAAPPAGGQRGAGAAAAAPAPARTFEVLKLATGTKTTFPAVASFSFSPDGDWLLLRPQAEAAAAAPAAGAAAPGGRGGRGGDAGGADDSGPGTDLLMRNLATGEQRYVGNVGTYAFDDSGAHLAYTVRGQQRLGNGVYVMTLAGGEQRMLDAMAADYDQLTWSEDGNHLAVLRGDKQRTQAQKDNIVLAWRNVGTAQQQQVTFDPAKAPAFPAGMVISEFSTVRFSKDGSRLLVGVKAQEAAKPAAPAGEAQANVDVWHWKDELPQSVQVVQINQARRQTFTAVIDLSSGSLKRVADEDMPTVTPTDDLLWAVGRLDKPYRGTVEWGASKADYYRINLATGERTPIETGLSRAMGLSADNKYFLYLKNGHVFSFDMASGKKTQIDGNHSFVNAEDDHDYEKPAYGVAGFTPDGKSALVYDRYDVWALPLAGGTPVNVTKGAGAKDDVRYRIVSLAPGGGRGGGRGGGGRGGGAGRETIDLTKPVSLSAYGQWTKKTGYFDLQPNAAPAPLIWLDKSVGSPIVARDADRMIFTEQTFREYPNYWMSDRKFTSPKQVTDADPALLKEFAWGSKTLIDYKNSKGQRLQATLTLPANYQPGKKYPMLVYFYELMSDTHHSFQLPPYDDRPHMTTYASNGYLVLQPDVVYEIGKPGSSALDCVTSAVREVIKQGYADPAHIGLQGHSWGGYESSFILTQTDMFAAIVTGAPPTDLTSFYDTLYRSTGTIQQGITEVGQVRMGAGMTPWSNHMQWESQSPIHNAPNIKTPFMILQGTADGSVDAGQGLELYAAARRLGKQAILLSYPDEGHHLGRRENQKDFLLRMQQFFDHYLKDAPMPDWMANGLPQLRKGEDPKVMPKPVNGTGVGGGRGGDR